MVLVDPHAAGGMKGVAKSLRSAGMTDIQIHESIGTILGRITCEEVGKIKSVPGVLEVEEAGEDNFQLPPPDSEIQ